MAALLTALHWLFAAVYPLALAYAVVSDARRLLIPNWTSAAIAAAFLPAALLGAVDGATLGVHYGVGAALLAAGTVLFARRMMGGGDVKLLAAAGVWVGWPGVGPYLALVAVLGGVLALCVLALRRFGGAPLAGRPAWMQAESARAQPIPYGVAIGLAAIILIPGNPALPPQWAAALAW